MLLGGDPVPVTPSALRLALLPLAFGHRGLCPRVMASWSQSGRWRLKHHPTFSREEDSRRSSQ